MLLISKGEDNRVRNYKRTSLTADHTTQLEEEDGDEIRPLQRKESVQSSPERCSRSCGDEERRAIPADVLETLELIGDLGDGCRDYGLRVQLGLAWKGSKKRYSVLVLTKSREACSDGSVSGFRIHGWKCC